MASFMGAEPQDVIIVIKIRQRLVLNSLDLADMNITLN